MSIESVYKKCLKNIGETESPKLLLDIEKNKRRFEKCAYTYWNESQSMAMINMLAGSGKYIGMTPTQVKHAVYEQEKEETTHRYLKMLCDLFDYKAGEGK